MLTTVNIYIYIYIYIYIALPPTCPVSWGCRIHQLLLCRGVRPHNERPRYDTKQSDGEVPGMLELLVIQSTPSLTSLPDPLLPGVVAPDSPIYGSNKTKLCLYCKLNSLK